MAKEIIIIVALCLILSQMKSSSDGKKHEIYFAPNLSNNYIVNGDFENPVVSTFVLSNSIPSWSAAQQIQIGVGTRYNPLWTSQICEVDGLVNTKIKQIITLPSTNSGYCLIKYQYAARVPQPFTTCQMNIYMNGKLIKHILPTNYNVISDQIYTPCIPGINYLEFEGDGPSDLLGLAIDNVGLYTVSIISKRISKSQIDSSHSSD